MERRLSVFAASAFIVAAVLASAWVTGQFTSPALSGAGGYVSELAARDQPWTRLFRAADALAGLACLIGVALVPRTAREGAGWLALAVFAALALVGGMFPLDCAVLSDPSCAHRARSPAHHIHAAAWAPSGACGVAAMVLLSLRWHTWPAALLAGASMGATAFTGAVSAGAAALTAGLLPGVPVLTPSAALALAAGAASASPLAHPFGAQAVLGLHPGLLALPAGAGAVQRVQAALLAGWLVYAALRLLVRPEPEHPGAPTRMVRHGTGPAVILTGGLGGTWLPWDRLTRALARGHRVTRFDRPGLGAHEPCAAAPCGPGSASSAPPTLYGEAARLAALAPAHPERVTVVAHGQAAWHAEAFARLHPLRVAGLVLVDPAPGVRGARGTSAAGRETARWLPALGSTWGAAALARLAAPALDRMYIPVTPVLPRPGAHDQPGHGERRERGRGRAAAAIAVEWLARRDMAACLRLLRADRPMPAVPVTVVSTTLRRAPGRRVAAALGAELVRVPRRALLHDPAALVAAVRGAGETGKG
ncbi:alpha/beta hydrolase [Nonomuraea sp. RK-328]|nr:alpha/beta hydrolase [Nonomuraea sp. RK-328]